MGLKRLFSASCSCTLTSGVCTPQVLLFPCRALSDAYWPGDRGAWCEGAPRVEVVSRRMSGYHAWQCEHGRPLRKPEGGSALSGAALRAFHSLDLGYDGTEGDPPPEEEWD